VRASAREQKGAEKEHGTFCFIRRAHRTWGIPGKTFLSCRTGGVRYKVPTAYEVALMSVHSPQRVCRSSDFSAHHEQFCLCEWGDLRMHFYHLAKQFWCVSSGSHVWRIIGPGSGKVVKTHVTHVLWTHFWALWKVYYYSSLIQETERLNTSPSSHRKQMLSWTMQAPNYCHAMSERRVRGPHVQPLDCHYVISDISECMRRGWRVG
jgi:hypothetical protein